MTVGSLFAGIGGFDLGFERAGFEIKWQVEIDPFCRQVLAKHWPDVRRYEDVRTVGAELAAVDVLCGGFPCQDISVAGKGEGIDGERSGLWREYDRLIGLLRPDYVVVENVSALLVRGLQRVLGDLAARGYDAEWDCIPASAVGAPHRRDRIWLVAYPARIRHERAWATRRGRDGSEDGRCEMADALPGRCGARRPWRSLGVGEGVREQASSEPALGHADNQRQLQPEGRVFNQRRWLGDTGGWAIEPNVGRVAHGVSHRVDRLRGLGNSIVPQIAQWIAERIQDAEKAGQP